MRGDFRSLLFPISFLFNVYYWWKSITKANASLLQFTTHAPPTVRISSSQNMAAFSLLKGGMSAML
ncbi:hypothetical protein BCM02_101349 [Paenibacillus methanolicus]|uniref:Uncharacterized protein n=1 Tax=Paenibacillus methanolicus TaxID=582686 RepID=A0A5S5CL21_9BACL|nr:hypothetical protein BCM02_101349 [Paenibacillus methanolicus]